MRDYLTTKKRLGLIRMNGFGWGCDVKRVGAGMRSEEKNLKFSCINIITSQVDVELS